MQKDMFLSDDEEMISCTFLSTSNGGLQILEEGDKVGEVVDGDKIIRQQMSLVIIIRLIGIIYDLSYFNYK